MPRQEELKNPCVICGKREGTEVYINPHDESGEVQKICTKCEDDMFDEENE